MVNQVELIRSCERAVNRKVTRRAGVEELAMFRCIQLLVVVPKLVRDFHSVDLPLDADFVRAREPQRFTRKRRQQAVRRRAIRPEVRAVGGQGSQREVLGWRMDPEADDRQRPVDWRMRSGPLDCIDAELERGMIPGLDFGNNPLVRSEDRFAGPERVRELRCRRRRRQRRPVS